MMNSVISKTEFGKVNNYVRNIINELIYGHPLSKDINYASCKYGGFGFLDLQKRYATCKLNRIAFLRDESRKSFIECQLDREAMLGKVIKSPERNNSSIGI
jgi:hypothetical protein